MPKGNEEYDEAEVAGYIVNIIDSYRDGWCSELEAYLGDDVYEAFLDDLPSVNIDDEDCFHDVYTNEDPSEHILNTFVGVNVSDGTLWEVQTALQILWKYLPDCAVL